MKDRKCIEWNYVILKTGRTLIYNTGFAEGVKDRFVLLMYEIQGVKD